MFYRKNPGSLNYKVSAWGPLILFRHFFQEKNVRGNILPLKKMDPETQNQHNFEHLRWGSTLKKSIWTKMSAFPYRYICLSFAEGAKILLRGAKNFDSPVRHHVSKCLKPPLVKSGLIYFWIEINQSNHFRFKLFNFKNAFRQSDTPIFKFNSGSALIKRNVAN